ncbi:MAG: hypothetical protein HYU85_09075 [Chloroflexi bacterium]|nr:hypothetical protein [Chloroflexota bacterium]MBI3931552.1 hypothetical protein [Chloroflexota bacterium]
MADMIFELTGEHFRRRYLLYVVELSHGDDKYFYVGQTGDRKFQTARPAFPRLAAHFGDQARSTQNQIYQYVARDILGFSNQVGFNDKSKQAVEDYLVGSNVRMYVYFVGLFDSTIKLEEHAENRRKVEELEKHVIDTFHRNGKRLMNKKRALSSIDCPYPEILKLVARDLELHI